MMKGVFILFLAIATGCEERILDGVWVPIDGSVNDRQDATFANDHLDESKMGAYLPWPNHTSTANSDPWLAQNHQQITLMNPNLLVINYNNQPAKSYAFVFDFIEAIKTSSTYHGYSDRAASPFLHYYVNKLIDQSDLLPTADWAHKYSTRTPLTNSKAFDVGALFSPAYASVLNYRDGAHNGPYLDLCTLFERGIINEVWVLASDELTCGPYIRKQNYDDDNLPKQNSFDSCVGVGCTTGISCNVTTRIVVLDPESNAVGCSLKQGGREFIDLRRPIPYLDRMLTSYFNLDFDQRFGVKFKGWGDLCDPHGGPCITYQNATHASGNYDDGTPWNISPLLQGCGTPDYPPNARAKDDFMNTFEVQSRCEHYGMGDAIDGSDIPNLFSAKQVITLNQTYPGCGGGWQIYWRQNLPGLFNQTKLDGSQPMRNFWPFLFY